ncbi:MAG TPA: phosphate ABC transporter permease subunit PstC [bacterium]|nr:phosphate ABC transporter permease subunit PstC [bacterium]
MSPSAPEGSLAWRRTPFRIPLLRIELRIPNWGEGIFKSLTFLFALSIPILIFVVGLEMALSSRLSLAQFGWRFLVTSTWDPVFGKFGALPFIYGTLVSSFLALLFALPLSLGTAIYLSEMAPHGIRGPLANLVELLAAIPSVIYGLWGILVLAPLMRQYVQPFLKATLGFLPFFQGPAYGVGMLTAGVILSVMIVPFIASVSREVLLAVPQSQREAALALGATRWEMIRTAVLPYGKGGIVGGIMLGLGRALGETMAVTMVIGNRPDIALSLFAPGYTMASVIANEFTEATGNLYLSALVEIGLVLFLLTIVVNALARLLVWRVTSGPKGGIRE